MKSSADKRTAAREIIEFIAIIPPLLRAVGDRLRQSGHGILPVHLRLLALLAEGPCNLSALAEKQAVRLPTMSNSISVLVERGWVKRTHSPLDRRVVLLELTPAGQAVFREVKRQAELRMAEILAPLSEQDCATLQAGLAVLRRAFAPVVESEASKSDCKSQTISHNQEGS